jgi:hypothetical protein
MVMLLVTNNRYVFHSFYLNQHLFFGSCFVVIAASGWLFATAREVPRPALLGLIAVAIPALTVARPEASLFAALATAPLLLSGVVPFRCRAFVLGVYGASTTLWSGYVAMAYLDAGDIPVSAIGPLALGITALFVIPILAWPGLTSRRGQLLIAVEAFIWLALAVLAAHNPEILVASLAATYENVVMGSWGSSLVVLATLIALVLVFCRDRSLVYLRFPVTASIPLFLLLAYFRASAYRVGDGDSLNRMLIQIVPLALLYIAAAATSARWGFPEQILRWSSCGGRITEAVPTDATAQPNIRDARA